MKQIADFLRLYAVTDSGILEERSLEIAVRRAIEGGATIIQLREKDLPFEEFLEKAKSLKSVCTSYGVPLIINDNIEVAIACNADGVHVGQEDTSLSNVRELLPKGKIIGVSCQTVEQAKEAEEGGADYIGVGAVFPTDSKEDATTVNLELLKEICENVHIPVVAIGGINAENLPLLKGSGIDGIAVISAIFKPLDISKATKELECIIKGVL